MFTKYMHLERLGNSAVDGINMGEVLVFPKLDGTNASIWVEDGELCAGSRNRKLSAESDNAGFHRHVMDNKVEYLKFFEDYPNFVIFGEWLVPHSLKAYRDEAWRKFYVFDIAHRSGEELTYIPFGEYSIMMSDLEFFNVICPIGHLRNPCDEELRAMTSHNRYLLKDDFGAGEGIVIKNYNFVNKFGHTIWAKVVTNEFKEKHVEVMGAPKFGGLSIEEKIINETVSTHLVEKVKAKIELEVGGWSSKSTSRLFSTVYHDIVTEELWDALKRHKQPKLDFKFLNSLCIQKIKELKPDLF